MWTTARSGWFHKARVLVPLPPHPRVSGLSDVFMSVSDIDDLSLSLGLFCCSISSSLLPLPLLLLSLSFFLFFYLIFLCSFKFSICLSVSIQDSCLFVWVTAASWLTYSLCRAGTHTLWLANRRQWYLYTVKGVSKQVSLISLSLSISLPLSWSLSFSYSLTLSWSLSCYYSPSL